MEMSYSGLITTPVTTISYSEYLNSTQHLIKTLHYRVPQNSIVESSYNILILSILLIRQIEMLVVERPIASSTHFLWILILHRNSITEYSTQLNCRIDRGTHRLALLSSPIAEIVLCLWLFCSKVELGRSAVKHLHYAQFL